MTGLLLLHGFTAGPRSWDAVVAGLPSDVEVLRPALLGHEGETAPGVGTFEQEVDRIALKLQDAGMSGVHIAGYSLGGRIAFGLLARHPQRVKSATIIAAHPGLSDPAARETRAEWDESWVQVLENEGLEPFVNKWEQLPLFESQRHLPGRVWEERRAQRLAHDPGGLARALRVLGLGKMPDWTPQLAQVNVPVALVVGAHDRRFRRVAQQSREALVRAPLEMHVVPASGHDVLLERPEAVTAILRSQLTGRAEAPVASPA
jgi:2-succinyl-6-hydroxy-2,4-cyclohexadiene-1-carboxylate synthase